MYIYTDINGIKCCKNPGRGYALLYNSLQNCVVTFLQPYKMLTIKVILEKLGREYFIIWINFISA